MLEKLIAYEAVHAIQSWNDLKNRLDSDRRCFAFFHPAMPDDPLIFVEVALTRGISGIDANFLRPSIVACGLDPEELAMPVSPERAREMFSAYAGEMRGPKRWVDLWSAGHTVSAVRSTRSVAGLIDDIAAEYAAAQRASAVLLKAAGLLPEVLDADAEAG